jgi:hypothetical protein
MKNIIKAHLIAFAAMLLTASACFAASANLRVSATIPPWVSFNAIQHAATYQVRSEDLNRGYIDLPNSMTVNVRTNVNGGIPVIVDNWGSGRVLIRESGTATFSDGSFTLSTVGYRIGSLVSKSFDSRIVLPADAHEGVYPISISVTSSI